jgi:pantoate--beta-alanine ligase
LRVVHTIAELRAALAGRRDVHLVPTMGNLHAGHLSLVRTARARGGCVVASIFVNPLQFAPHEDFASYPRTLAQDCQLLADGGCDVVFAPTVAEMYPEPQAFTVDPPRGLADILEGAVRPGFFTGVCTVVLKLFGMVQPAVAVFGKKDYQQWLVIRAMVRQFALPITIVAGDTVRDPHGLALSSRNGYLTELERVEAMQLHVALGTVAAGIRAGRTDWAALETAASESLRARGWVPDYVAIRRREDLGEPTAPDAPAASRPAAGALVVLAAARLGGTRLIDNLEA